jgi:hypothetical protein
MLQTDANRFKTFLALREQGDLSVHLDRELPDDVLGVIGDHLLVSKEDLANIKDVACNAAACNGTSKIEVKGRPWEIKGTWTTNSVALRITSLGNMIKWCVRLQNDQVVRSVQTFTGKDKEVVDDMLFAAASVLVDELEVSLEELLAATQVNDVAVRVGWTTKEVRGW